MNKVAVVFLVLSSILLGVLISFSGNLSSYDSISTAINKKDKFVHLIARLDTSEAWVYDPINNPNLFVFHVVDSLGIKAKVIYNNAKPRDIEKSSRLVLKGMMRSNYFECNEILMKCPSKYKGETANN